jgi:hypothetical protein
VKNVPSVELPAIAVSSKREFYTAFHSDCLEYCKVFVMNYCAATEQPMTMVDRVHAFAITGTRLEASSRQNDSTALSANRALESYAKLGASVLDIGAAIVATATISSFCTVALMRWHRM